MMQLFALELIFVISSDAKNGNVYILLKIIGGPMLSIITLMHFV